MHHADSRKAPGRRGVLLFNHARSGTLPAVLRTGLRSGNDCSVANMGCLPALSRECEFLRTHREGKHEPEFEYQPIADVGSGSAVLPGELRIWKQWGIG